MLIYFVCFLFSTPPPQKKSCSDSNLPYPHITRTCCGERNEIKSPPDFQSFIEERSPSGVKGQEDVDYCDTERS